MTRKGETIANTKPTNDPSHDPRPAKSLRARADEIAQAPNRVGRTDPIKNWAEMAAEDVRKLVHELQIHQIELELQNEELRETQIELARTRDRYSDLYEFAPVGYLSLGGDGVIREANLTAANLLARMRPSLIGRKLADFVARESQDTLFLRWREALQSQVRTTCELQMTQPRMGPDDLRFPPRIWAQLDIVARGVEGAAAGVAEVRVALSDISERKQAAQQLLESEERLRLAAQAAHFGAYDAELTTGQVYWSAEMMRIFGLAEDAPVPVPNRFWAGELPANVHPEDRRRVAEAIRASFDPQGKGVLNDEHRIMLPDGKIRWVLMRGRTRFEGQGKARRAVRATGTVIDITELKRAEAEHIVLQVTTDERQRIGQDLHDTTSQELTGLGFMAQSLLEKLDESGGGAEASVLPCNILPNIDSVRRIARKMEEGVQRALEQVRRFSQGLMPVELDAEGLMASLSELAARTSAEHQIECAFDCAEPVGIDDNATATQLYLIAKEAVANALKHARANHIRIELSRDADQITLLVRDDGVGIDPPKGARGDAPETNGATNGMGLRIMRHRASLIQANLSIEPTREGGTRVRCVFVG